MIISNRNGKRLASIVAALVLLCVAVTLPATGTSESRPAAAAGAAPLVTLEMYAVGDRANDTNLVLEQLNEKTVAALNTRFNLEYIGWSDWQTKYQLLFAAGEEFDAIFTADWAQYVAMAQRNGFMEITEAMLREHAPRVWENTPAAAWDQVRVNGRVFMVPQLQDEFAQKMYILRGDLRAKYGAPEVSTLTDLTPFLEAVRQNEPAMAGILATADNSSYWVDIAVRHPNAWQHAGNNSNFLFAQFDITDPSSGRLFSILDSPEYLEFLSTMREWNQRGYIARNLLSNTTSSRQIFENGQSAVFLQNVGTSNVIFRTFRENNPSWKAEVFDGTAGKGVLPYPASAGGIGINARSRNADRVLQMTDYLRYVKEANFLAQRGIQGRHWDFAPGTNDENMTIQIAGGYGDSFTWGPWRNNMYQTASAPADSIPGFHGIVESLKSREVNHPLQQFNFNDENVRNELAAVKSISDQYQRPLDWGFVDPVEGLANLKTRLQQAGFEKIMDEMQRQADAFMAARR